jgi:uncharacterized protein HemY
MIEIQFFGKILILLGIFFLLIGLLFSGKIPYFGKLPGDIYIKRENFTFFFPITSFLILSFVLSLIFWIIFKIFVR